MTDKLKSKSLREICEERARSGDGAFAIAVAIFDLSDSQEATAKALQRLGNGNASTDFGAIEGLAMMVSNAGKSIGEAIDGAGSSISAAISTLED